MRLLYCLGVFSSAMRLSFWNLSGRVPAFESGMGMFNVAMPQAANTPLGATRHSFIISGTGQKLICLFVIYGGRLVISVSPATMRRNGSVQAKPLAAMQRNISQKALKTIAIKPSTGSYCRTCLCRMLKGNTGMIDPGKATRRPSVFFYLILQVAAAVNTVIGDICPCLQL